MENLSKRGTASQQLHGKLLRQLTNAASELAQLQQLVGATEQAQQQAAALAEQLRLHDDAEDLSVREAEKQLQAWMLTQQRMSGNSDKQPAPQLQALDALVMNCSGHRACVMAEGEATTILQQLAMVCDVAGATHSGPLSSAAEEAHGSRWAPLLQQVQRLQISNTEQFKQCMFANNQLWQLQEAPHASQDSCNGA